MTHYFGFFESRDSPEVDPIWRLVGFLTYWPRRVKTREKNWKIDFFEFDPRSRNHQIRNASVQFLEHAQKKDFFLKIFKPQKRFLKSTFFKSFWFHWIPSGHIKGILWSKLTENDRETDKTRTKPGYWIALFIESIIQFDHWMEVTVDYGRFTDRDILTDGISDGTLAQNIKRIYLEKNRTWFWIQTVWIRLIVFSLFN